MIDIKNSNFFKKKTKKEDSWDIDDIFGFTNKNDSGAKKNNIKLKDSFLHAKSSWWKVWDFLNDMFLAALKYKASDIHIEPEEDDVYIRFRVDGHFKEYKSVNIELKDQIIARIKIMSALKIDENRLPQDWKINYKLFWGKSIDMRVSILPNIYWEKIVIRILKKWDKPALLKDLWILPYNMIKIQKHLDDPSWMILAVWPTGSGKSTTLFSLLSQFDPKEKNITTLEDPVEYRIPWVNHSQIYPKIWFTFASWLRSILRQDPDIIMVWEIRDEETAKLAAEASITWHIVFSTLHTNSAVNTIQRLINLWIDPLLISSAIRLIISQRLVRKLCDYCKIEYTPTDKIRQKIIWRVWRFLKNKNFNIYKHKTGGCEKCNNMWYKWRIWIYEVLEITSWLEELLLKWASKTQLEIFAIWQWLIPIRDDAIMKVVLWDTSLEEVLSVLWRS